MSEGFELYKLYLDTAERVSDRRAAANQWFLSVNGAVIGLYGFLGTQSDAGRMLWGWAIPAAGILVCFAWAAILESYRKLNAAKFQVLQDIESSFEHKLFAAEQQAYKATGRRRLARLEGFVPWSFVLLYLIFLVAVFIS